MGFLTPFFSLKSDSNILAKAIVLNETDKFPVFLPVNYEFPVVADFKVLFHGSTSFLI
jgi:hypothetical protein